MQFLDGSARQSTTNEIPGDLSPNEDGYPIAKVWDPGDLLVPVGEFLENNHPLAPSPSSPNGTSNCARRTGGRLRSALDESGSLGIPLDRVRSGGFAGGLEVPVAGLLGGCPEIPSTNRIGDRLLSASGHRRQRRLTGKSLSPQTSEQPEIRQFLHRR